MSTFVRLTATTQGIQLQYSGGLYKGGSSGILSGGLALIGPVPMFRVLGQAVCGAVVVAGLVLLEEAAYAGEAAAEEISGGA